MVWEHHAQQERKGLCQAVSGSDLACSLHHMLASLCNLRQCLKPTQAAGAAVMVCKVSHGLHSYK